MILSAVILKGAQGVHITKGEPFQSSKLIVENIELFDNVIVVTLDNKGTKKYITSDGFFIESDTPIIGAEEPRRISIAEPIEKPKKRKRRTKAEIEADKDKEAGNEV